ncbi:hypothetical protein B5C00_03970 [Staphylococcus delphini]|uniref:hypothetical protein n=1 Tax=Staphylococcus delphini TaxID=53344 RepID=UPI000BBC80AC|nr:hypothetical protein [Staphylococcus delphini]PCF34600.1 hypothetical protein B5C00_03970 [Staphylococcus delphini]
MDQEYINEMIESFKTRDVSSIIKQMKATKREGKSLYELVEENEGPIGKKDRILKGLEMFKEELTAIIFEYDYLKPYKYCALFNIIDGEYEQGIENLRQKVSDREEISNINDDLANPKLYEHDEFSILKFNYYCKGATLIDGKAKEITSILPMVIVIHKESKIIEFRVARINSNLKNNDPNFYEKRIDELIDWINDNTIFNIKEINVKQINTLAKQTNSIENGLIKYKDGSHIKVYGQKMELKRGSSATLEAGISEDIVLPILGDLKLLIKDNEDIFDHTHKFYDILMEFIENTEEESTYPWVQLIWLNEVKAKQFTVKFRFDVLTERGYSIIEFHKNTAENKEMMKVAKFIDDKCREKQELSESGSA